MGRLALAASSPKVSYFANTGATTPIYPNATYPHSAYHSGTDKTWVAWEASNGAYRIVHVAVYSHATATWSPIVQVGLDAVYDDDHGNPAICRDADGYWHAFGGSHSSAMKHWVTSAPDNPANWVLQPEIDSSNADATYPHPVLVGSTLYVFFRAGALRYCRLVKSTSITAGVVTWAASVDLGDIADGGGDGRWYNGRCNVVGSKVYFVATRGRTVDVERQGLYVWGYNTADGSVENISGGTVVAAGSLPVNLTTLNASFRIGDSDGTNLTHFWTPDFAISDDNVWHFVYPYSANGTTSTLKYFNYASGSFSSVVDVGSPVTGAVALSNTDGMLTATTSGGIEIWQGDYSSSPGVYKAVRPQGGPIGARSLVLQPTNVSIFYIAPEAIQGAAGGRMLITEAVDIGSPLEGTMKLYLYTGSGFAQNYLSSMPSPWPPAVAGSTTWNASDKYSSVLLSTNLLLAAHDVSGDGHHGVRSVSSASSGKRYFEIVINSIFQGSIQVSIGLVTASFVLSNFMGDDLHSAGLSSDGKVTINSTAVVAANANLKPVAENVIGFAFDYSAKRLWVKNISKSSNWNNDAAADPATGANGLDMSPMTWAPFFICAQPFSWRRDIIGLNTGQLAYAGSIPSGFTAWP